MIWLVLACAAPVEEEKPPPEPLVPAEGIWTLNWDQTYGGDCALDDMSTRQPETVEWRLELESIGFTLYDEYDYPTGCDLVDDTFGCSEGVYDVPYADSGYDATEYIHTRIDGVFTASTAFEAEFSVAAECVGADCAEIGTAYGADFTYPCAAVAGITAVLAE